MPKSRIEWFRKNTNEKVTKAQVIADAKNVYKQKAFGLGRNINECLKIYINENYYYKVRGEIKNEKSK